jgi:dTDP-4-amino-4,6-dideoxy-D-galactose acyltransferase
MIDKLDWDSNFFNLKIGKLTTDENHLNGVADSILNQYDLVYIFSEQELNDLNARVHLVDVKVNFSKTNLGFNEGIIISEYNNTKHSYNKLLELAILSGVHSRFKKDHRFNIGAYEKLYKMWIDKSIDKSIAQHVLVDVLDGELAGFVTLQFSTDGIGIIGLIAVDPLYQGKKIASRLIQSCENLCISNNINKLEVSTQLDNNPAMQLYKNAKFNIKTKQFIYHHWTYDTI